MDVSRKPTRSSIMPNKGDGDNNIYNISIGFVMRIGATSAFVLDFRCTSHFPESRHGPLSGLLTLSLSRYAYLVSKRRYFDERSNLSGALHSFRRILTPQGLVRGTGENQSWTARPREMGWRSLRLGRQGHGTGTIDVQR